MRRRISVSALAALAITATTARAQTPTYRWDFTANANSIYTTALGTLVGNASVSSGVLNLDGAGDWVDFSSHLIPTSGSYTVSLFARALGQTSLIEFLSQGFSGGPGFFIGSDGGAGLRVTDAWFHPGGRTDGFNDDGIFHSYALTVGATESNFYLDGALFATVGGPVLAAAGGHDTRFGAQFNDGETFHGQLDDIRIYDRALSAADVAGIARDGSDLGTIATPEPGSILLLATGMVGVGGLARRRKRAA